MSAPLAASPALSLPPARNLLPLLALGAIALAYGGTLWSMLAIWARSSTFAHGALIFPIGAWLVWRRRAELGTLERAPCYPALALVAVLGALWLMARLAQVQVAAQFALVALLPAAALAMLGPRFTRAIAFPLAYLLLAVPSGEVLIGPLIEFTASFTVGALQLTGVPVYREGSFLTLPTGNWAVAEACSGLRYLIASFALGTLYAYLSYRSFWRRAAFVAASVLLPVLANGVRAYLIVLIGHWSNMQVAAGVDHVVYGWVFFCLLLLALFWLGARWREPVAEAARRGPAWSGAAPRGAAAACVLLAAAWPALAAWRMPEPPPQALARPIAIALAPALADEAEFRLVQFQSPDASYGRRLRLDARHSVVLQLGHYRHQRAGAALEPAGGARVAGDWRELGSTARVVPLGGGELAVRQTVLERGGTKLLVWRWYRQSGVETSSAARIKLLLAAHKLLRLRQDGTEIVVATSFDENPEQAAAVLTRFLILMRPSILRGVEHDSVN
ncbi:MAG: exosortase A [Pseudomonadota bacterium]